MLQHSTIIDGNKTVLIDKYGMFYSYNSIIHEALSYVKLIRMLKLNQPDYILGIHFKDNFSTIAAFIACLLEPVNFTLIPVTKNSNETLVKLNHAGVNVLLSNANVTNNILTINSDFHIIVEGLEISRIDTLQRIKFRELCYEIAQLKYAPIASDIEISDILENLYGKNGHKRERHYIGFHSGITSLFKASVFQIESLHLGVEKAQQLYTERDTKIAFDVPFELLYDIISGVISPILTGKTVIMNSSNFSDYSPTTIYTSAAKLDALTSELEIEDLRLFSLRNVKILNLLGLNVIRWLRTKKKLNMVYGNFIKTVFVTGKLPKKDFTFYGKLNLVNIFAIAEVASFVCFKRFTKFSTKKPQSVGIVPELVSIETAGLTSGQERALGELFVYSPDSCVSYLQLPHLENNHIEYSFIHGHPGKIRTGDAGYIKDNELFISNKAKFTFINDDKLVDVDEIINITQQEPYVNHCAVILNNEKLIVVFDLQKNYILTNSTITYEKLMRKCIELKAKINDSVNVHSKVHKVIMYPDPNGLKEINGKLVSRYF